ncbi:hypothetical protein EYD10_11331 [Varanus komodoensis]|nr:hypothetical protein EYD10_11331 [Varanus komodoensis]
MNLLWAPAFRSAQRGQVAFYDIDRVETQKQSSPDACNTANGSSCPGAPSASRCGVDFQSGRTPVLCLSGAIFLLGLATNGLMLRPLLQQVHLGNVLAIYLLSLGVADILCLSPWPLWMVCVSHNHQWPLGGPACHGAGFLFHSNIRVSIVVLCAVSLEHYLAVAHPLRSLGSRSRFSATVACASVALPVFLSHLATSSRAGGLQGASCYDSYPLQPGVATFNYLRVATGLAPPLLILGISYLKVARSVQASETPLGCRKAKVRHLSLGVTAILLLCSAPCHVLLLARSLAFSRSDCRSLCAWERRLQLPFSLSWPCPA